MSKVVALGLFTVFLICVGCGSEDGGDGGPQPLDSCKTPDECPSDAPYCSTPPVGWPRVCSFACEHPKSTGDKPKMARCGELGGTCVPRGNGDEYYCFRAP